MHCICIWAKYKDIYWNIDYVGYHMMDFDTDHKIPEIDQFHVWYLMGHLNIFYVGKVLFAYEKDLWQERI